MLTTERTDEGLAARAGLRAARDLLARRIDAEAARAAVWPFLAMSLAGLEPGAAATLIANAAFLAALYYLYRLIRLDWPALVATRALWLLALFPTALAFFIPYTESLYVLLAVL